MPLTIGRWARATTYHMTYQLHQLGGDITPGLSEESCALIDRWLSISSTPTATSGSHSISHRNLERPRSTVREALSLARELMSLVLPERTAGVVTCAISFRGHTLTVAVHPSITTYESSREDDRLLSEVFGMGAIRILCFENAGRTVVFTDDHLISRAEARALLEAAQ